ncbi:MAG: hypothetical protein Q7T71_06175 [Herbiconiux sp.]|nr:hypothetical protein [Herbiconiux sp.]
MANDLKHQPRTIGHDVDSTRSYLEALSATILMADPGEDTHTVLLPDQDEREQAWHALRLETDGQWTAVRAPEGDNTDAARSIPFTPETIATAAAAMRAHDTRHPRRSLDDLFDPAEHRPWPTFIR